MDNRRQFLSAAAAFTAGSTLVGGTAEAATPVVTLLNGDGAPKSRSGIVGDFYIDDRAHAIYGPKSRRGWGRPTSLIGPPGAAGRRGDAGPAGPGGQAGAAGSVGAAGAPGQPGSAGGQGPRGYEILNGTGPPAASLGEDDDFYIDTASTQLYGPKTDGVWGSPVALTGHSASEGFEAQRTSGYLPGQLAVPVSGPPAVQSSENGFGPNPTVGWTVRLAYTTLVACSDLRLCMSNWGVDSPITTSTSHKLALEVPVPASAGGGVKTYPVYFGALRQITLASGAELWSDPCSVWLPAGATFYVRLLTITGDSNGYYAPQNIFARANWRGATYATYSNGDSVDGTGTLSGGGVGSPTPTPTTITCTPAERRPQIAVIGDERVAGYGTNTAGYVAGYINDALTAAGCAAINVAGSNETVSTWLKSHSLRARFLAGCDYAICGYGIHDVIGGTSLASLQAAVISAWQHLDDVGLQVWQDTLFPVSVSTDGWITTTHQTTSGQNPVRSAFNQWIRAGAPVTAALAPLSPGASGALVAGAEGHPLSGTFDSATTVETQTHTYGGGTDSGLWRVGSDGAALTADGSTPNVEGNATAVSAVPVSAFR